MVIHYKKLLLFLIAITWNLSLIGQNKVSKTIEKTFSMTNSGKLYLENNYGEISVHGWNKESLVIKMEIEVIHKKKENAQNLLERIGTNINENKDYIIFKTAIAEKNTGFITKYWSKVNSFDYDRSNLKINYTVYLPKNAELDITNRFGDVIVEDWAGKFKTDIQHGDLWLNGNLNFADITMKYGKIKAETITYGNIRLKNGKFIVENAEELRVNSSGSTLNMETIKALELYSSKDEIKIDVVHKIKGDIKFTDIDINTLNNEANLVLKISDLTIKEISTKKPNIKLTQESSEININVENTSLKFNATLEEGLLRLPKSFDNVSSDILDKGNRIRKINATYGKEKLGRVTIQGKKGLILIKEN
ncbi:hypothetical protein [Maribacter sp.]|uniref:hypothetical protein n=1 Tax=Maribacter sp. TaxID=1897614 RepID=UPI0025BD92D0|nr:hypothetical protein [Maribacter sp.]